MGCREREREREREKIQRVLIAFVSARSACQVASSEIREGERDDGVLRVGQDTEHVCVRVCVCVRACVCAHARAHTLMSTHACLFACTCVQLSVHLCDFLLLSVNVSDPAPPSLSLCPPPPPPPPPTPPVCVYVCVRVCECVPV